MHEQDDPRDHRHTSEAADARETGSLDSTDKQAKLEEPESEKDGISSALPPALQAMIPDKDIPPGKKNLIISAFRAAMQFSGPLPPPQMMRQYKEVDESIVPWILSNQQAVMEHLQKENARDRRHARWMSSLRHLRPYATIGLSFASLIYFVHTLRSITPWLAIMVMAAIVAGTVIACFHISSKAKIQRLRMEANETGVSELHQKNEETGSEEKEATESTRA